MQRRFIKRFWGWALVGILTVAATTRLIESIGDTEPLIDFSNTSTHPQETLRHAFETHAENFWIEAAGRVTRLLPDDIQGSRHQRFIVELDTGQTLLIAHNIDMAPRLEGISPGDRVRFRGEYVWNSRGGVIHWTHHDPGGSRVGGWLEWQGKRYR